MHQLAVVFTVAALIGGGVTKTTGQSGITQFWTDDYKVFDQVYGKTSDKEIFGATLPPSIGYGIDLSQPKKEASDKRERYISNADDEESVYSFDNRYSELLKNQAIKALTKAKPSKPAYNFIGSDFKPITQNNDPETYSYLKHLEKLQKNKDQFTELKLGGVGGFKPYLGYTNGYTIPNGYPNPNPEETEGYKSIQDILDAHEANKGKVEDTDDPEDQVKYLTYGGSKTRSKTKPRARQPSNIGVTKTRCPSGRCRKRATNTYRVFKPYVRRIKHKIITY